MTLGPVGDNYEQEADAVAKQVVSTSTLHILSGPAQTTQRQEEEEELQMKPEGSVPVVSDQWSGAFHFTVATARRRGRTANDASCATARRGRRSANEAFCILQRHDEEEMQMSPIAQWT